MNREGLIKATASEAGISVKEATGVIDSLETVIRKQIASADEVVWSGLVKFEVKRRAEGSGVNPQTREPMTYPAKNVIKVTPLKALKDAVPTLG
jgi:DNA-binding protein HU-beta